MVAHLVGDDVGPTEIAGSAHSPEVLEEAQVEIHPLVGRAVERPHRRLGESAGRLHLPLKTRSVVAGRTVAGPCASTAGQVSSVLASTTRTNSRSCSSAGLRGCWACCEPGIPRRLLLEDRHRPGEQVVEDEAHQPQRASADGNRPPHAARGVVHVVAAPSAFPVHGPTSPGGCRVAEESAPAPRPGATPASAPLVVEEDVWSERRAAPEQPPGPQAQPPADQQRQAGVDPVPPEAARCTAPPAARRGSSLRRTARGPARRGRRSAPRQASGRAGRCRRWPRGPTSATSIAAGCGGSPVGVEEVVDAQGHHPGGDGDDDQEHSHRGHVLPGPVQPARRNEQHQEDPQMGEEMDGVGEEEEAPGARRGPQLHAAGEDGDGRGETHPDCRDVRQLGMVGVQGQRSPIFQARPERSNSALSKRGAVRFAPLRRRPLRRYPPRVPARRPRRPP